MDPARRAHLERAYLATTYSVASGLRLRIGEPNAALDALLDGLGAEDFAYLTAWNPGSRAVAEPENRAAQERLRGRLLALGLRPLEGAACADDRSEGAWPAEPSFLVPGLGREEAATLGRAFGQAAIVVGLRGGAPMLLWLEE